ncbi:MAG: NAD(P)H-hydrate dehydratase [Saprospiraceae bacterium]
MLYRTEATALLIVGSLGKMGAAVLATKTCLQSGAGLVTTHAPKCGYTILQISCPEAMANLDKADDYISEFSDYATYKAIGIGCSLDPKKTTQIAFLESL